jgi:hypothetical protein
MRERILSDLVNNAKRFQLEGVEFTQEDVDCVERLMTEYGKSYEEAIDLCLGGIYDVLNIDEICDVLDCGDEEF